MIPYCQHQIREEDREALSRVLDSDRITQGPSIAAFEEALSRRVGSPHAVAVSSGTSALQIALQALGVGPGDEVLVPSLTFLATANAVLLAGGIPRFVDIDPQTLALDPEDLERKLTPATRGAIVVHYAGHAADASLLRERLGAERFLLEDACHALGAEIDGRPLAADADAACFSFHPAKHITTGEGGAITCASERLATLCRRDREHGVARERDVWTGLGLPASLDAEQNGPWVYEMQRLSGNHRLSDLAAALGTSQLTRLDAILDERRAIADRYAKALDGLPELELLAERPGTRSAWHLYPIQIDPDRIRGGRAALYDALHAAGVGVQIHYIPIHLQPYYRDRFGTGWGDLPATEAAYLGLLSLPMFAGLIESDQERVIDAVGTTIERLRR